MSSTIEVLDRVLDKGMVIDTSIGVSVAGIALVDVDMRVVIASIETYAAYADTLGGAPSTSGGGEESGAFRMAETSDGLGPPRDRVVPAEPPESDDEETPEVVEEDPPGG